MPPSSLLVAQSSRVREQVWGFNLLSSPARLAAWRSATKSGKKTFSRRLNLVQSSDKEFGVLVWLPIFADPAGDWTVSMNGVKPGHVPVGSVNGVYGAQFLLRRALQSTYSTAQLGDTAVFLFDDSSELGGRAEFLAAYGAAVDDPYTTYGHTRLRAPHRVVCDVRLGCACMGAGLGRRVGASRGPVGEVSSRGHLLDEASSVGSLDDPLPSHNKANAIPDLTPLRRPHGGGAPPSSEDPPQSCGTRLFSSDSEPAAFGAASGPSRI